MSYKFYPHTDEEMRAMLATAGVKSLDDLYHDVPQELQLKKEYELPEAMSEIEVRRFFDDLGMGNITMRTFLGAGYYDHYSPAVVQDIVGRSEFLTAYTPYQAEISQGTLQYIFEYQSMMAELTGMEVSNASMYDGTTATAEAMMMAVSNAKKRNRVLVSETVSPYVLRVLKTYAKYQGIQIDMVPAKGGVMDHEALKAEVEKDDVAGVIVATPNFYGILEDYTGVADLCHEHKTLLIMHCVATALSVVKSPAEWGADIAVGDGQSLGIPLNYGGPYVGFLCTTKKLIRKMPGRIVGKTLDNRGQRAFVLTLQAREQHIRRQKATSNICSNQSLMALFVTMYCSLMGRQGLKEAAGLSYAGAHYLCEQLVATGHFTVVYDRPFFNEFVVRYDGDVDALQRRFVEAGFFGGVKVAPDQLMFAVTEKRTKEEIDKLVELV